MRRQTGPHSAAPPPALARGIAWHEPTQVASPNTGPGTTQMWRRKGCRVLLLVALVLPLISAGGATLQLKGEGSHIRFGAEAELTASCAP